MAYNNNSLNKRPQRRKTTISSETKVNYVRDFIRRRRRRAGRLRPITANGQDDVKQRATQPWSPGTCTTNCTLPDALFSPTRRNIFTKPLRSCASQDHNFTFHQDHSCDPCFHTPTFMAPFPDCVSLPTVVCESFSA